jgi:hypothetical protein
MKFSTYALKKFNSLLSYVDAVERFNKMNSMAEETMEVSHFDLNSGSSKFQRYSFNDPSSTQRVYMDHEDASSPTVRTDSVLITAGIEAEENRDVATCDIPNAFIQTNLQANPISSKTRQVCYPISSLSTIYWFITLS